jgi:ABC-type Mn2+/Zn2+ transport system permease subunit
MNNLPGAFKFVLNILFYVIYSAISLVMIWFILTNILGISYDDPNKIWYVVLIFVLIITFIFRKFFYISLKNN